MPWSDSKRRDRLPDDWAQRVKAVKRRDGGRCTWKLPITGGRCPRRGSDVDHRINNDNHDLSNLALLCRTHHNQKTQAEARAGKQKPVRPPEAHPGMILPDH